MRTSSSPFVFAGGVGVGRTDCFGFEVDVCDEGTNITDGRRSGFGVGVGDAFTRADCAPAETAAASMRVEMRPSFIRANVIVAYLISDTEARLHGRKPTWPSVKTDLINAGANWVDSEVIVDNGLVSSRKPDDIPAFNEKMIEEFAEGQHRGQRAATR